MLRDGNDGWWSSFFVQIGTPGQTVQLLPGTSSSAGDTTWVVIDQGCSVTNSNLTGCPYGRGELFQSNFSSTWSVQQLGGGGLYSLNTFEESSLGLSGNAYYGFDTVNLGLPGAGLPSLTHQIVAGYATNDFWIGSLGLSPIPFNFTSLDDPQPSLVSSLRNQSLIQSLSWAYTAGAYYKSPPVLGSLTLGGYDTTRFVANNATFAFGADFSRDLLVGLHTISYDTDGSTPLLATSIDVFIDSMVTQLWLPTEVCQAFEQAFNLIWHETASLYLISEDTHNSLLAQNPSFIFTIGASGGIPGDTVNISLPYAAFDLNVSKPMAGAPSRYFPLKRAENYTQYTLGRVFLQEAYVVADYDRQNFSVSQALFPSTSVAQNLAAIEAPEGGSSIQRQRGISKSAIAGTVIGAVVALTVCLAFLFWYRTCQARKNKTTETPMYFVNHKATEHLYGNQLPLAELDNAAGLRELDAGQTVKPELAATRGHWERHELAQNDVQDSGSHDVPAVELEAHVG